MLQLIVRYDFVSGLLSDSYKRRMCYIEAHSYCQYNYLRMRPDRFYLRNCQVLPAEKGGICADDYTCGGLYGDVGKQWLALYAVKNETMEPILASSLKVVIDSTAVPAGYSTGIHMFGSEAAFNLNSSLYDWNNSAKSVFVFFKTDSSVSNTSGSTFTGGAGLAVGALATAICTTATKKNRQHNA